MALTSRGQRANGPDSGWVDLMVKNLKDELQRQLVRVRDAWELKDGVPVVNDAKSRAVDARTLAVLGNALERLDRLEQRRAIVRETKVRKHDDDARTALERRLDKLAAAGEPPPDSGES